MRHWQRSSEKLRARAAADRSRAAADRARAAQDRADAAHEQARLQAELHNVVWGEEENEDGTEEGEPTDP